jgi:hypothetical protein
MALRISGIALISTLALVGVSVMAMAQDGAPVVQKKHVRLALLSGKGAAATPARKIYLGQAPYICGPSGFGHTSKCFARASLGQ